MNSRSSHLLFYVAISYCNFMFLQIFYLFVSCGYIYSDRDKSFISHEFVSFMSNLQIPTSKISIYNLVSNGQCEKCNDIIWSTCPQKSKLF